MTLATLAAATCSIALLAGAPAGTMSAPDTATTQKFDADAHKEKLTELEPRTGIPVGWTAPDAKLRKPDGKFTTLYKMLDETEGPVVLIFYRGGWCPYCTKHLAAVGAKADKLKELGATVIGISPEGYDKLSVTEEKGKLENVDYTLVSDARNELATRFNLIFDVDDRTQKRYEQYGINLREWNGSKQWKLPVPAAFVINQDKTIEWMYANENYATRVTADKLVEAVAAAR